MIESFAAMLGQEKTAIGFRFPTNPDEANQTTFHPNDRDHLEDYLDQRAADSKAAMERYEAAAKTSKRLKQFQEDNEITYFQ
jgi:hypothetical protein